MTRDENGRFIKGVSGNPAGRSKRTDEEKYNSVLIAVVSPDRFKAALERQMVRAERGDLGAFKYICKLLGLEVEKRELTGADGGSIVISWDED